MKAEDKIKQIIETIESGKTVYFSTIYRVIPVNVKTLNSFRKSGYDLFKAQGKNMMMLNGKRYECIDGCKITFA